MYVVIQRAAELPGAGLLPIAGQPLIARQLQWMRTLGCHGIAVEIGSDAASMKMARGLRESALGVNVTLVLAGRYLTPREIARRAGFPEDALVVALPAMVVGGGDIFSPARDRGPRGASIQLRPPRALAERFPGGCLGVLGSGGSEMTEEAVDGPGWGVSIGSHADALALGMAALDGRISANLDEGRAGILIHGAERSPGVWAARGAVIEPGAEIVPPVFLGMRAIVCAGARVGPSVILGDGAVVEPGAVLSEAIVCDGTIVGEKLELSRVILESHAITQLSTGERAEVEDTLVLGPRRLAPGPALWARALSLVLLTVLAPALVLAWACAGLLGRALVRRVHNISRRRPTTLLEGTTGVRFLDALPRLVDVAQGRRFLVGVSAWAGPRPAGASRDAFTAALTVPCGLLSIEAALTPPDADAATRLRARLWYGSQKRPSVDGILLLRCLGRAFGVGAAAHPVRRARFAPAVELP
jgi:hypothetical protein